MTTRRKGPGGRREPPGGRPPKGNVKFYCYVDPGIVKTIDEERGALTRGEFVTMLIANYKIDRSNVAVSVADRERDPPSPQQEGSNP